MRRALIGDADLAALVKLDRQMCVLVAFGGLLLGVGLALLALRQAAGFPAAVGAFVSLWPYSRVRTQRVRLIGGLPVVTVCSNDFLDESPHVH